MQQYQTLQPGRPAPISSLQPPPYRNGQPLVPTPPTAPKPPAYSATSSSGLGVGRLLYPELRQCRISTVSAQQNDPLCSLPPIPQPTKLSLSFDELRQMAEFAKQCRQEHENRVAGSRHQRAPSSQSVSRSASQSPQPAEAIAVDSGALVSQFCARTGTDNATALKYLQQSNWMLETAIRAYQHAKQQEEQKSKSGIMSGISGIQDRASKMFKLKKFW